MIGYKNASQSSKIPKTAGAVEPGTHSPSWSEEELTRLKNGNKNMNGANLSGVNLNGFNVSGVNFMGADSTYAI